MNQMPDRGEEVARPVVAEHEAKVVMEISEISSGEICQHCW